MVVLPVAWREQLARERCASYLLDGETLDAADGLWLSDRRLRGLGLVVDIRPSAVARREAKKRRQRATRSLGAEDATLEDRNRDSLRAD